MNRLKIKTIMSLAALAILPFIITGIEKFIIRPAVSTFQLPSTSTYLVIVGVVSLLLLSISAFRGNTYGLGISKKLRNILGVMFLVLIAICYLFLFSLQLKGPFDSLVIIHLVNWIVTVFREEFILRGVIQTESSNVLKGSFLKISKSIWFTTILFSLWHLVNFLGGSPWQTVAQQMVVCIPMGIILGLIREKTGSTLLTFLLHICYDLLSFSLFLLIFGKLLIGLF